MMKWQPVDDAYLVDKVRHLYAENDVENVKGDRLLEHAASFIDEVLAAVLKTSATVNGRTVFTALC